LPKGNFTEEEILLLSSKGKSNKNNSSKFQKNEKNIDNHDIIMILDDDDVEKGKITNNSKKGINLIMGDELDNGNK
jgi:hypothetical protein